MPGKIFRILIVTLVFTSSYTKASIKDSIVINDTIIPESFDFLNDLDSLLHTFYVQQSLKNSIFYDTSNVDREVIPVFSDSVYIARLNSLPTLVNLPYNDKVRAFINLYTNKRRKSVEFMLGLSEYYFPIFEEMLDANNLPIELKYLPVIESALNPRAVSRAGATGLWQFMYTTAKLYDLEVNSLVDERRDPMKATAAAIEYLKNMYNIYNDWALTIASYNCGPGNVNKAIRRSKGKTDFWQIYPYLPRETRGYVPAYIAATYVMNFYKDHNLVPRKINLPYFTDTIIISEELHLKQIADVLRLPLEELRDMNPQYRKDIIPAGKSNEKYVLKLPANFATLFIDMQDSIFAYLDSVFFDPNKGVIQIPEKEQPYLANGPSDNSTMLYYKIKPGDNLGFISSWYNVKVSNLKYWNNLRSHIIRAGQKLVVYVPENKVSYYKKINTMSFAEKQRLSGNTVASAKVITTKSTSSKGSFVYYKVRPGDSPWSIAKKFKGVSENDIMRLNNIRNPKSIHPGQVLKVKEK